MTRWLLTIVVLTFACHCAPIAPRVTPSFPARTVYVRDGAALVASSTARAALIERLARRQLRGVTPYQLSPLLVDVAGRRRLAAWIDEVHRAGGEVIVPVAGIDRVTALRQVIAENPTTWLDGAVTEFEYWNRPDREVARAEFRALLEAIAAAGPALAPGRALRVGAYLGYPTADEAAELAPYLDFVHLDYSVASPRDAWAHVHAKGGALRDRFAWFAEAGVEVWPIFYAVGEVDMAPALTELGLAGVEARFQNDLGADPDYHQLAVTGFAYFTLEALPDAAWPLR